MARKSKILHKTIELLPTLFKVDVWVGKDLKKLSEIFSRQYGASADIYEEMLSSNFVCDVFGKKGSKLGEEVRIVMVLEGFSPSVLAHESVHVCWHLSNLSGVELNYESQEWNACMMEMIMRECLNKTEYIAL